MPKSVMLHFCTFKNNSAKQELYLTRKNIYKHHIHETPILKLHADLGGFGLRTAFR